MNCSLKTKAKLVFGGTISWFVFSASLLIIIYMLSTGLLTGGYSFAWNKYLSNAMYNDAVDALNSYCWDYYTSKEEGYIFDSHYYEQLYSMENSNFRFMCISDEENQIPGFYYNDEKKQQAKTYEFELTNDYYFTESYYYADLNALNAFIETLDDNYSYDIQEIMSEDEEYIEYYVVYVTGFNEGVDIKMQAYIPAKLTANDNYFYTEACFKLLDNCKPYIFIATIVSAIFMVVFTVKLINRAGRRNGSEKIYDKAIDRMPFDLFLLIMLSAIGTIGLLVMDLIMDHHTNVFIYFLAYLVVVAMGLIAIGLLFLGFAASTAVRVKCGTIFSNTLVYKITVGIINACRKVSVAISNIGAYKKVALIFIGLDGVLTLIALFLGFYGIDYDYMFIAFIIFVLVMLVLMFFEACVVYNVYLLQTSCNKIAEGDFEHKADKKYTLKLFGGVVESINNISDGMDRALKDKIKSEHFKTELITNVSHDIKTPLTSIITYVNLLQNSKVSGDEATEYLDVLERQSGKLKRLIEDLVEASKASTGNLNLEYSIMDISLLIEQAVCEYEGKLSAMSLNVVLDKEIENNYVKADGRYLWRVIDNLLSNICKYSLENTRVYITVERNIDNKCIITFKNISKYEIKITPEELTERFVRGDKSRNTEGSGLGLSIARSLVEAMGGRLYIEVDGDLYKAVLVFDCVEEEGL
ncbi:MAG: sensor histidine kinase [Lachnospiraceae bacterium]|nr:sensor histidine kinase [Lachnospiraceae bacterium]